MPTNPSGDYHDPDAWIKHAESDLAYARAKPKGVLPEHRCWHAQQAAEKALKSVLISLGADIGRSRLTSVKHQEPIFSGGEVFARFIQSNGGGANFFPRRIHRFADFLLLRL